MATIAALTPTSSVTATNLVEKTSLVRPASSIIGLPGMGQKAKAKAKARCSMEEKLAARESGIGANLGMVASAIAAAAAAATTTTMSSPAVALVDERLSTEGTGLPFGLSNNLLGWILFGVFGLIWALYFVYTATLEEDDDSGLSL